MSREAADREPRDGETGHSRRYARAAASLIKCTVTVSGQAALASRIDDIIRHRKLTQTKAAAVMGLKQPDVSRLLSGDFRDFSVERLLCLLMALDCDIDIVIRPKPARARRPARLQIVAAA